MINKRLIALVQAGTGAIKHTEKPEDLPKLIQVINTCWPNDELKPSGSNIFYYKWPDRERWIDGSTLPTGLTPIPLDDFFKEEEGLSQDQIDTINAQQKSGKFHPYTCDRGADECEVNIKPRDYSKDGVLIATKDGWVCPCGKYKQDIKPPTPSQPSLPEVETNPFTEKMYEQLKKWVDQTPDWQNSELRMETHQLLVDYTTFQLK